MPGKWISAVLVAGCLAGCGRTAPYDDPTAVVQPPPSPPPPPAACITSTDTMDPTVNWQRWQTPTITCFGGKTFTVHGDEGEYAFAMIPPEGDPGWVAESDPNISFNQNSRLCDASAPCMCLAGGDFTYFQTELDLTLAAQRVSVAIENVDDGVQVTLFNTKHPDGFVGGNAFYPGGTTADFGSETVVGHNRVVLTHVDDCCKDSRIDNAQLTVDGNTVTKCQ